MCKINYIFRVAFDCVTNNPCSPTLRRAGEFFYPQMQRTEYIQCDASGGCFPQVCGANSSWSQGLHSCLLDPSLFALEESPIGLAIAEGGTGVTVPPVNPTQEQLLQQGKIIKKSYTPLPYSNYRYSFLFCIVNVYLKKKGYRKFLDFAELNV